MIVVNCYSDDVYVQYKVYCYFEMQTILTHINSFGLPLLEIKMNITDRKL